MLCKLNDFGHVSGKTKSAKPTWPSITYSASPQYHRRSLVQDDGEHDDADNDKYGDVSSPRQIDHRGLGKFNEHEEFNNDEHEKDLDRVDVEYG
jgi:hypothetical protein